MNPSTLSRYLSVVDHTTPVKLTGRVSQVIGMIIESMGPSAAIGETCLIHSRLQGFRTRAEVVGFRENRVLLMPLGVMEGIEPGSEVVACRAPLTVPVGAELLGRVLDGLGRPLDGKGHINPPHRRSLDQTPPNPISRTRILQQLATGVRSIDGLLTCGRGQRVGIFAGSGVGKSTLLGMIARKTEADVNVIALIGERGREVRDFIEKNLGADGLRRSVVVVATSDQPALVRIKGAFAATTIAEYFRDQGLNVLLMMDSVTRLAMAQREIGLAVGEPPTTRGYTPSVFAMLPRLMERAGTAEAGSITALYTVLVEGDDMNEPIADAVRSILDGHIVLSRRIAARNQYPAVDVLESVSRVMDDVVSEDHRAAAQSVRRMLAAYQEAEDLINIGAYARGSNPDIDQAIAMIEEIRAYLRQSVDEESDYQTTCLRLNTLAAG
jgi:flagellum-specific ATP synthase